MPLPGPANCSARCVLVNMPAASSPKLQSSFPRERRRSSTSHHPAPLIKRRALPRQSGWLVLGLNCPKITSLCLYVGSVNKNIFILFSLGLLCSFFFFVHLTVVSCAVLSPGSPGCHLLYVIFAQHLLWSPGPKEMGGKANPVPSLCGSSVFSFLFYWVLGH